IGEISEISENAFPPTKSLACALSCLRGCEVWKGAAVVEGNRFSLISLILVTVGRSRGGLGRSGKGLRYPAGVAPRGHFFSYFKALSNWQRCSGVNRLAPPINDPQPVLGVGISHGLVAASLHPVRDCAAI